MIRRPILRYHGGIYNDLWGEVVNVFRVLRDPAQAAELERLIRLTPFARDEFLATETIGGEELDSVERARRALLRSFAGFGSASVNGEHRTGFRANSNRSGTTPAHDWASYPDQIRTFVERLRGVVIENRQALDVMRHHDTPETLHYVDPPYVAATRNMDRGNAIYTCDMSDEDHTELAQGLRELKGMVCLSGYRCDLYDSLYGDWRRIDRKSFADGARPRIESLWFSPGTEVQGSLPEA